jgi:adenylate cyclase
MPLPRPGEASGPAAVVATDVTLGRLSDFVRQFSHSGYGDSALLSASGMVLARSDQVGMPPAAGAAPGRRAGRPGAAAGAPAARAPELRRPHRGESYLVQASTVPATGWTLLSWVPERKVLGGLRDGVFWGFGAALLFLALMLVMSWRVARGITQPIERLARNARRIGQLQVRNLPRVNSRLLEIQHLDQALDESARGLQAFMKFAPVDVVNQLMAQGHTLRPGGESRVLTIMFVDVRGFTQIAETVPAEQLAQQLTRFFNVAARVITSFGGTIDKFIGDGLMVLWGAPLQLDRPELQACKAALALQRAMDTQNARWRRAFCPSSPSASASTPGRWWPACWAPPTAWPTPRWATA